MITLSGRVPGRASEPSRTRVDDGGGDGTFRGIMLGYLGFSGRRQYIGERAARGASRGPHTPPRRARQGGRALVVFGSPGSPLRAPFGLRLRVSEKLGSVDFRPIPRIFPD